MASRYVDGHEWQTRIRVRAPLGTLPHPLAASEECRNTPAYHWDGRHRHSEQLAILQCTLSGEGRIRRRGSEHRLPPGTAFLCAADDPDIVYFYPPGATAPWRFVYLLFRGGNFRELAAELADRFGPALSLGQDHPALLDLLALRAHAGKGLEMTPGEGARLVYGLVAALAEESSAEARDGGNPLVERGLRRLEERLTRGAASVAEAARELGVSREHFTRAFTREVGQSPKAWLTRRQMLQAARLVKDGGLTVKEIASRLGYPSPEAFAKAFARHFRMSPRQFRRDGVPPLA